MTELARNQYVDVHLENGRVIHVIVPEGENPENTGYKFMQLYHSNRPAIEQLADSAARQGQHSLDMPSAEEATNPFRKSVMDPGQPTTWDRIADYAKSIGSGAVSVPTELTALGPKLALGFAYGASRPFMTRDEILNSPLGTAGRAVNTAERAVLDATGGSYAPQQPGSDIAKDATAGGLTAALTGGSGLGPRVSNALLGAASGTLGNLTGHAMAEPDNGQPNDPAAAFAAGFPFAAKGGIQAWRSPAASYAAGRAALNQLGPRMAAEIQAAEAGVNQLRTPGMPLPMGVVQTAPPGTAIGGLLRKIALLPQARKTQDLLRASQGDRPETNVHELADTIDPPNPPPPASPVLAVPPLYQTPQQATPAVPLPRPDNVMTRLADRVRRVDTLRGANSTAAPITQAATEEMGNLALLLHGADELIPPGVKAAFGTGGALAKWGAWQRIKHGPQLDAADEMAAAPTLADLQRIANTNTKLPIWRAGLQALAVPNGTGVLKTPYDEDSQQ